MAYVKAADTSGVLQLSERVENFVLTSVRRL